MSSAQFTDTHGWTRDSGYQVLDLPVAGFYREQVTETVPGREDIEEFEVMTYDPELQANVSTTLQRLVHVPAQQVTRWVERVEGRDDTLTQACFRYLNRQNLVDEARWNRKWEQYRQAHRQWERDNREWLAKCRSRGVTNPMKLAEPKRPKRVEGVTHEREALIFETSLPSGLQIAVVQGRTGKCRVVSFVWDRLFVQRDEHFNPLRFALRNFKGATRGFYRMPMETLDAEFDSTEEAIEAAEAWAAEARDEDRAHAEDVGEYAPVSDRHVSYFDSVTLTKIADHQMLAGRG